MDRIKFTNCVLVLSGMYANFSSWMQTELRIAKKMNKPIIAIMPQGAERMPIDIQNTADAIVRWNTQSIVDAIRQYSI